MKICVWSGPRNVSTALMYSFAQRSDTRVVDEPLYGHYLKVTGAPHPGADEVVASMTIDGDKAVREHILGPCDRPVLYVKCMAHHLVDLDLAFVDEIQHAILIRDPREMLPSLAKHLPDPTLAATGLDKQVWLLEHLQQTGHDPAVLDAREILTNPAFVLAQMCHHLGLLFDPAMLSWPAGPRPEDGIWAKYWYENVHKSTGFEPYRSKTEPFPTGLGPLLEECLPLYRELHAVAIRAEITNIPKTDAPSET